MKALRILRRMCVAVRREVASAYHGTVSWFLSPKRRDARFMRLLSRGSIAPATAMATRRLRGCIVEEKSLISTFLPPERTTLNQTCQCIDDDLCLIFPIEPDSPGAKAVHFDDNTVYKGYVVGERYSVPLSRSLTDKTVHDMDELYTREGSMDTVVVSHAKCAQNILDTSFMRTVDSICCDSAGPGSKHRHTGKVQWVELTGGINRKNLIEAGCLLIDGGTTGKWRCPNHSMLINDFTARQILFMGKEEWGSDQAYQSIVEGHTSVTQLLGMRMVYTIRRDLVPDNTMYVFTSPERLGRYCCLSDLEMFITKKAYHISSFAYWTGGAAISNIGGVAKIVFRP